MWAAAAAIGDAPSAQIKALEAERKRLRQERHKVALDLKNAEKKRARLIEKAKGLSDQDLLDIIALRAAGKAKAKAKAKVEAKAAPKADAKAKAKGNAKAKAKSEP